MQLDTDPDTGGVQSAAQTAAGGADAPWWQMNILGNAAWAWAGALALAALVFVALLTARWVIRKRLARHAKLTATKLDDLAVAVLGDLRTWCILAIAVYAGGSSLVLPTTAAQGLKLLFIVALAVQVLITSRLVVDFAIGTVISRNKQEESEHDRALASASGIIRFIAMLILGTLLVLLALSNMGVQITPLLTGLGIGGIAVALAAQSILGDLFGSLTIVFDKPFLVGDFIVVGSQLGTVEHIGVKTTRVRALSGEQLVFANSDLLSSRIQNFKRMQQRRIVASVGIVYETPPEGVEKAAKIIRESVESLGPERVRFDRAHFKQLGAYSLDFEYVYFVLSSDFNVYMDAQQEINLKLFRRFSEAGLEFAYPTSVEIKRYEKDGPEDQLKRRDK